LQREALQAVQGLPIDVSEVGDVWWGGYTGESQRDLDERIDSLLHRLRQTRGTLAGGGGASIVVGHSHFFRALFRTLLCGVALETIDPLIAESLQANVLPCCGILAATLEWDKFGDCRIVEARPLLGTLLRAAKPIDTEGTPGPPGSAPIIGGCFCNRRGDLLCPTQ